MAKRKTIGIVGQGFVGTAVNEGLAKHYNIETFDIDHVPLLKIK